MTINEKTKLVPKENQKSYVIPIPQEEDPNNNTSASILQNYDSYALTKEELTKYIEEKFWNRVRYICFSLYWLLCIVALFCSCYLEALDSGLCEVAFEENGTSMLNNATFGGGSSTLSPPTPISMAVTDDNSGVVLRMLNQPSS
ncbi:uncharacterized protein LOC135700959 [Ochlerotatus camptorhynchus]|uniref:uncharacterized protein LOC135700959 n=1 Tax=Ochlerotatus camptorhynchus TaxID=644619 RepID=UPI0031DEC635